MGLSTEDPAAMSSTSSSIFFRLPPELRNMVYDLVINPEDGPNCLTFDTSRPEGLAKIPGLVQVCQQMRKETYSLFLGLTYFDLHCHRAAEVKKFEEWLDFLGPHAVALDEVDVLFPIHRSRLPKTIKARQCSEGECFMIRLSAHREDEIGRALLKPLDNGSVPRIRYKAPRDVNATEFKVQLTITHQEEADRAISQLLGPLCPIDDTLRQVSSIFSLFTKAAADFNEGDKILIDLWQYRQFLRQ